MFMKEAQSGDLIRVLEFQQLASPLAKAIDGKRQAGEEEQDEREFCKADLVFPSGEPLPQCWTDPKYQIPEVSASHSAN